MKLAFVVTSFELSEIVVIHIQEYVVKYLLTYIFDIILLWNSVVSNLVYEMLNQLAVTKNDLGLG